MFFAILLFPLVNLYVKNHFLYVNNVLKSFYEYCLVIFWWAVRLLFIFKKHKGKKQWQKLHLLVWESWDIPWRDI